MTAVGYAIVHGSRSRPIGGGFIERIARSAVEHALRSRPDILSLWSHDTAELLGRVSNATLRLTVDPRGLHFALDLPSTSRGRDVQELIRRRDVTSVSFAFRAIEDQWELVDGIPQRTVLKMELFEISPVAAAAYEATMIRLED